MKYRGIELPAQYAHLVKNIDSLNNLIDDIKDLQSSWDSLSLLGELTQVGSEITTTRQHFKTLSERLGCSLVKQSVQDVLQSLESQAQHAIDILVRNLFERTADIGFLATDLPLTQALCQPPCPAVAQRMHSYVSKYSVYRNLALIKPDGTLHQDLRGEYSEQDKACWLIDAVQRSTKPYVERHGPLLDKDARASKDMGLIYAWKVEQGKRLVGYVALEFDLQGESETLFSKVLGHNQTGAAEGTELNWAVCGIVDSAYRVLSSSDTHHVPPGLQLKWPSNTHWGVIQIGPMAYLGSLRSTRGYQGYQGPGWMGFSLMPINQAFAPRALSQHSQTPRHIELRASLLGEEVIDHQRQAEHIQGRLNRSVWNGNIQQRESSLGLGSGFSKTLLWEISRAGERTRQLFEHTLSELNDRTIALELIEQRHCAMLAVDLLDRNLYERANDCRWWADTPILANCLANPSDSATLKASQDCLQHINSLYTVYVNILLILPSGQVLCSSQPTDNLGVIDDAWLKQALVSTHPHGYAVSDFEPNPLYGNKPTYIYAAPVRQQPSGRALGVLAVVFDSEPQLEAILSDCVSDDHALAYLVDEHNRVISSTTDRFVAAGQLTLDLHRPQSFKKGEHWQTLMELDGEWWAVGGCNTSSYREYKSESDCYQNNLSCVVIKPIGHHKSSARTAAPQFQNAGQRRSTTGSSVELATFRIGKQWFGMDARSVKESFLASHWVTLPHAAKGVLGNTLHRGEALTLVDLNLLLNGGVELEVATPSELQLVVLQTQLDQPKLAFPVEELGAIPTLAADEIRSASSVMGESGLVQGIVYTPEHLVMVLHPERLLGLLDGTTKSPLKQGALLSESALNNSRL